jgi:o-succinylbenzoate synthase
VWWDEVRVFALPMRDRFRGITIREGVLLHGPAGWAEFAPFRDYSDADCRPWLRAARAAATTPFPTPVRSTVPINTTVPVVAAERAFELVRVSGCGTAKVKVADPGVDPAADADRLAAVRAALGPDGRIRIDANGGWTVPQALSLIERLDAAAGGLEYVEQPCRTIEELAAVRAGTGVPIAADESIRRERDPLAVARAGAADIAVVKVAPLGGVAAALRIAAQAGLPVVVSSAVDSAVGLAAGLALAGALPELPYACGLGTRSLLTADVSTETFAAAPGLLAVPTAAPQPDSIGAHLADADTTRDWRDRLQRVQRLLDEEEA